MKRLKKIAAMALTLCLLLTLLTGCMKIEIGIDVKSNGKADISMLYAMSDEAMEDTEGGLSEEEAEQYREEGWTVEEYAQDGYTGVLLTKNDVDLNDAEFLEGATGSMRKEGSVYIVDLNMINEEDQEDFAETASWLKSMGASYVVRVTLPAKPLAHNATSVSADGKTLEWDVLSMDPAQPLHVEFKTGNSMMLIGIAAAAILVIAVAFVAVKSRGKSAPAPEVPVSEEAAVEAPVPEEAAVEVPVPEEAAPEVSIPEEVKLEEPGEEETV